MKGSRRGVESAPILKSVLLVPIVRVDFWIKKSPIPQPKKGMKASNTPRFIARKV
jgi:hypothetical protein